MGMKNLSCAVAVVLSPFSSRADILTEVETGNQAGFQHAGSISELVCHPDGLHVLSSARDQCARLWEIKTGRLVRLYTDSGCGDLWGIRIVRGGKQFLAASSSGKIFRFEIATGKLLKTYLHSGTAYRIALTPDGEHFVGTDGQNNATLWNIETGNSKRNFTGHSGDIYTAAVVDGGKSLVTGSDDKSVKKWNLETGECLKTLTNKPSFGDVYTIAPSPDRTKLAMVSGDDFLRLLDSGTLKEIWKLKLGEEGEVVAWSPDGKMIASTSDDDHLYLVDSEDGEVIRKIEVAGNSHTPITFTNDGKTVISGGDNHLHLHDVETGKRIEPELGIPPKNYHYDHVLSAPDGKRVYIADGSKWEVRDRLDDTKSRTFLEEREIKAMALSKSGSLIATCGSKEGVTVRETSDFTVVQTFQTTTAVYSLLFTLDGRSLITGGKDGLAILWDLESGKKIREMSGHAREIEDMTLSSDGEQLVTASRDGSIRVWDPRRGVQKAQYFFPDKVRLDSVASLNLGRSLVVAVGGKEIWGRILPRLKPRGEMNLDDIKSLADQLGDTDFEKRQLAMEELATYGKRVFPVLEKMEVEDPEVRARMESVPDVFRGVLPIRKMEAVYETKEVLSKIASDPRGELWAGIVGSEGTSKIMVGEIDRQSSGLVVETIDLSRGVVNLAFSPNGSHLASANADGTYTLFKVNRE